MVHGLSPTLAQDSADSAPDRGLASLASLNPASGTTTIPRTASTYSNLFNPAASPACATAGSEVTAHARSAAGSKITAAHTRPRAETTPSALG